MIELVEEADLDSAYHSLGFVQRTFGNLMWFTKVYTMLKCWLAPWRRAMQGVSTATEGSDFMVSTKRDDESAAVAQKKLKKDMGMLQQYLQHLRDLKMQHGEHDTRCMMPISVLRDSEECFDFDDNFPKASSGGDASGTCWSIVCHNYSEAMVIHMPVALQDAIKTAGYRAATDPLRRFIIAIAEHNVMVEAIALLQWGSRWQADCLHAAWYHTDSQNSFAWARSGFASNDIAQELCRLIGALQAVYTLHMLPVW